MNMKKITFPILFLLIVVSSWAQIIVSNPALITKDYAGEIELIYDATKGTAGLLNYTGTDGVYAHIGVITNLSTSNSDWKHAPTWGDNSAKYKLTSLGNNKWKLVITPSMASYFGLTPTEVVKKLAMVFRNGLKTKEGKDTGGTDIFVTVYDAGLNVTFTSPTSNQSLTVGTTLPITVNASVAANLELRLNYSVVKTTAASTSLTHSQLFNAAGDYTLIASATLNSATVYDTLKVCVPEPVVNQTRPTNTQVGINYIDNSTVTLVYHAPNKSNVFLMGEFNDWSQLNAYQLKKDGEYWWITLSGLTPGKIYGYQYLVDGTIRTSDPYTEMVLDPWNDKWINEKNLIYPNLKPYPAGKTDGLVATFQTAKPAYNWESTNFSIVNRENLVIYELLIRDFTAEKSLQAAIQKLDYLKTLGVTAIELMPVQEFDGNNSWGYNPNHYFAPDKAYGTAETYKQFVDECHKRGIAVILDIVLNHATGSHPFAQLFWNSTTNKTAANNPWFNVDAPHPYSVFHDFNHSYQGTRDFFKRMIQFWLTEYKIDGYRLDLTKGITQKSSTESTASAYDQTRIDYLTEYYNAAVAAKSDVMFILEHFCDNSEEMALATKGMYLWRNVNNSYSQAAMAYSSSSDFSGMNTSPRRWVGYAESHDEERNFYKAKAFGDGIVKTDSIYRISRVPLNIAFTTLIPGPKMVWQFGELGYDISIDALGGRTAEKPTAFGWLNLAHRKAAYDNASKIISLRKLYPNAFTQGSFSLQVGTSNWSQGRSISLTHSDLSMLVLGNFTNNSINTTATFGKTGKWYNLLTGTELDVTNVSTSITLAAGAVHIYTDRKVEIPNSTVNPEQSTSYVYPTLSKGIVNIISTNGNNTVNVYNMVGAKLISVENATEIDLGGYNKGMYFFEIIENGSKNKIKVIKE